MYVESFVPWAVAVARLGEVAGPMVVARSSVVVVVAG